MKGRKGAVPVIATVLLIAIITATVLVVYAYVSGATVLPDTNQQVGRMLEKLKTVEVKAFRDGQFHVFIMNTGDVDSVIDTFYVTDSSGSTILAIPVGASVDVGQTVRFDFDPFLNSTSPWSWYEIMGVTQRGTKVKANLYGFLTGAYELGPGPQQYTPPSGPTVYERDRHYSVYNVTVDGVPTNPSNLSNLTAVDGIYFNVPATSLNNSVTSFPTGALDLDINGTQYNDHGGEPISDLSNFGSSTVLHFNVHSQGSDWFMSSIFSGNTLNMKYPKVAVTIIFDLQGSGWAGLTGTLQFFDWSLNDYVTSGNGYYAFTGPSLPNAARPPAVSGYRNLTVVVNTTSLIGENGEWKIKLNCTTNNGNDNIKMDYFAVIEEADFMHAFETIFWFRANDVINENNVTQMTFSTTGIFPASAPSYWYAVFNFDTNNWHYLGEIPGSPSLQTSVFQISSPCSSYIQNGTRNVASRIIPSADLPSLQQIQIDQSRLIVRQWE